MSRQKRQVHQSALRQAHFRRYFPASWFSSLGSWVLRFLIGWSAWDLTQSATWVGIVAALMLAPAFVLSPLFGILSDRVNPRHGLMTSMLVHGLIGSAGGFALLLDAFDLTTLLVLAVAMGAVTSGHSPMRLALIPLLVSREALPSAVGLSAMTFNVARIIGPAVAAWLLNHYGAATAYLLSVLSFAISGTVLATLRGVGQREPQPREALAAQFSAGLRYARQHQSIPLLFALTAINGVLGRTVIEMLPALSGAFLQGGSAELATLTASAGTGSIVGGLIVSRQSAQLQRLFIMVVAGVALATVVMMSLALLQDLSRLMVAIAVLAMCTTMAGTGCQTMTQLSLIDEYRGRVISLWTLLAMGAPAIGSAFYGVLADQFGFVAVLAVCGALGLALLMLLASQRDRIAGA